MCYISQLDEIRGWMSINHIMQRAGTSEWKKKFEGLEIVHFTLTSYFFDQIHNMREDMLYNNSYGHGYII